MGKRPKLTEPNSNGKQVAICAILKGILSRECHNSSSGCGKLAVWRIGRHRRCEATVSWTVLEVVPVLRMCGNEYTGATQGATQGATRGATRGTTRSARGAQSLRCQHVLLTLGQCFGNALGLSPPMGLPNVQGRPIAKCHA